MAKFVLVSSKHLLSLLRTLRPGSKKKAFSPQGYREPVERVKARRAEDLSRRIFKPGLEQRYEAKFGSQVPSGKVVVAKEDFDELQALLKSKKGKQSVLETQNKGRKGTRKEGDHAHISRNEEGWVAFDEVGQPMSQPYSSKRDALREVKVYGDWLQHSKHPEAMLKRGARLDPSASDPLTRLLMDNLRKKDR